MVDPHRKWSQERATTFEAAIWAIKIALICVGIGSCLILFKIAVIPCTSTFLISTIPSFWSSIKAFLYPPYIYILLHFIIVAIVASSTFHHPSQIIKPVKKALLRTEKSLNLNFGFKSGEDEAAVFEVTASQGEAAKESRLQDQEWKNVAFTRNQEEVIKPMAAAASVDKNVDPSTETSDDEALSGKSGEITGETDGEEKAGLPKPEEPDDSLDTVWKAIMESQGWPATWKLKKSDTWDSPPRAAAAKGAAAAGPCRRELRKSDTFRERVASAREKSTNQDELHRRADEFIRKINNDLRLQREESDQRHIEMVNRGVY
ncbi:uncharacterized protein LOC115734685 isoform X3 [Rhodamnia argentea]|uniref:Uncharacterized protein LOC115734685 isoform X3 n=1 Tax=Rhodamnia argentea TaxID=178133 RepID=A0A8B8NHB5_9MYRT|nr:uncharacterized protein LOC115734685 isoform X3 [Rhodamnia argentea]